MNDANLRRVCFAQAVYDLEVATGIGGGNDDGLRSAEVADLSLLEPGGGCRLCNVIDSGAATTPRRFGALAQFVVWERAKDRAGSGRDFLSVGEMAGLVISQRGTR